jgi:hypothetical protein
MSQPSVPSTVPQVVPNRIAPVGDYVNGTSSYWVPTASGGGGGGGGVSNPLTATLACAGNDITGAGQVQADEVTVNNTSINMGADLQLSSASQNYFGITVRDTTGSDSSVTPFLLRGNGARPYQNYTAVMNSVGIAPPTISDGLINLAANTGTTNPYVNILTAGETRDIYTAGGFYISGSDSNIMSCPPGVPRQVLFPGFVSTPTLTAGTITTNNVSAQSVTTNGVLANGNGTFNYPVTFNSTVTFAYPPASGGLSPRTSLFYSVTVPLSQTIPSPTGQVLAQAFTAPATGVYMIQWTLQYSPGNTTAGNADAFNCVIYQTDEGTNVPKARASIPVLGLNGTTAYPSWTSMTVLDTLIEGENYTPQTLIYNRSGTLATTLVWNLEINITSLC